MQDAGNTMTLVDLAVFWEWEYDQDFVTILNSRCRQFGLNIFLVQPFNLPEILQEVEKQQFSAHYFFDRASDTNPAFEPVVQTLLSMGSQPINDPEHLKLALDKAALHHYLIEKGVHVPYTIILSPNRDWTKIKIGELIRLGEPFIIKPALGGGGVGVELNAKSLFDIVKAKEAKNREACLLQEKVLPIRFGDRRAWFRVFYVCGQVIPCWWDDITHIYQRVTAEEEKIYGLEKLRAEMLKIAELSGVNFFSTEFAIVDRETFVAVDYVNDQCDMRLKSVHPDGVPDDVVEQISFELARFVDAGLRRRPLALRVAGPNDT
jgi:hypothetical protein